MQVGAAERLLGAAGALTPGPRAAAACKGTGTGMAVFVRVQGIPDALCVELGPDATVADLRREAQAQAGQRRVARLRFAGELLTGSSVALADAGIGPQAVVDAEGGVALTFVEKWSSPCRLTFNVFRHTLPVTALEGLRLVHETRPYARPFSALELALPGPQRSRMQVRAALSRYAVHSGPRLPPRDPASDLLEPQPETWRASPRCIEAAPAAEAVAAGIKPGMQLELRDTEGTLLQNPFANTTPEEAQRIIQEIQAKPQYARDGLMWNVMETPPGLTVVVDPEATLLDAWRQAQAQYGFRLGEVDAHYYDVPDFFLSPVAQWLDHEMLCGELEVPEGAFITWVMGTRMDAPVD